jgi:hypothetical protein
VDGKITTGFDILNNSFDLDAAVALGLYASAATGLGANDVRFKNNVCRWEQISNTSYGGVVCHTADARAAEMELDCNVYQFATTETNMYKVGTAAPASNFAAYKALWDAIGGATTNEDNSTGPAAGDPLFIIPAGTIQSAMLALKHNATSAIGIADSDATLTDFGNYTRGADPDSGAYEFEAPTVPTFTAVVDAEPSTVTESAGIAITTRWPAPISIAGNGGEYAVSTNGGSSYGAYTSAAGLIQPGAYVKARLTSSDSSLGVITTTLTVAGVQSVFSVTTEYIPSLYTYEIANSSYDGKMTVFEGTPFYNAIGTSIDMSGDADPDNYITAAVSFPSVNIANGTPITSATLSFTVTVASASADITVNGEVPLANTDYWRSSHLPTVAGIGTTTVAANSTGLKSVDVTAIVQAQLDHADFALGDFLNYFFTMPGTSDTCTIAGYNSAGNQKAKLVIL